MVEGGCALVGWWNWGVVVLLVVVVGTGWMVVDCAVWGERVGCGGGAWGFVVVCMCVWSGMVVERRAGGGRELCTFEPAAQCCGRPHPYTSTHHP